jgi:hypothetical protein
MNDFSELEDQLKKLRPVEPSPDLITRIERLLAETPSSVPAAGISVRRRQFNWNWLSLGLGLAAATAVLILARVNVEKPPNSSQRVANRTSTFSPKPDGASPREFVAADITRVVYHTSDDGLRFPSGSTKPMRRVRTHSRETVEWRNPRTGATLRVTYPTEEISLLPVSGQ